MPNKYDTVLEIFKQLEDCKICCKVSVIQCMNSKHVQQLVPCMKACLECIEVCDVTQYFIAARSKNVKQAISFCLAVLKTCIKECEKAVLDSHLKKVNKETTAKACKVFMATLKKFKNKL